jgi:hypothetical protein
MKRINQFVTAFVLTCVLAHAAAAGDMYSGIAAQPTPTPQTAESQPSTTATNEQAAQEGGGESQAASAAVEAALAALNAVLSII